MPEPTPQVIYVQIEAVDNELPGLKSRSERSHASQENRSSIVALVDKYREHTRTVRYRPQGDREDWEIGEPYIPQGVLAEVDGVADWPATLRITVNWG